MISATSSSFKENEDQASNTKDATNNWHATERPQQSDLQLLHTDCHSTSMWHCKYYPSDFITQTTPLHNAFLLCNCACRRCCFDIINLCRAHWGWSMPSLWASCQWRMAPNQLITEWSNYFLALANGLQVIDHWVGLITEHSCTWWKSELQSNRRCVAN